MNGDAVVAKWRLATEVQVVEDVEKGRRNVVGLERREQEDN